MRSESEIRSELARAHPADVWPYIHADIVEHTLLWALGEMGTPPSKVPSRDWHYHYGH